MSSFTDKYHDYSKYLYGVLFAVFAGIIIAKMGVAGGVLIAAVPLLLGFFYFFFQKPKLGLYFTLVLSFFIATLGRYIPAPIPFGLGVDILLVVTYVVLLFKYWRGLDMSPSYNDVVLVNLIWLLPVLLPN